MDAGHQDAASGWAELHLAERIVLVVSLVVLIGGVFVGPHLLCKFAKRALATTWPERIRDALIIELLGLLLLTLWPLKVVLKRWVHGSPGAPPLAAALLRWGVACVWLVLTLGTLAILAPQLFFLLTDRTTATTWMLLADDALSMLLAMLPQIIATLPYVFVMSRRSKALRNGVLMRTKAENE